MQMEPKPVVPEKLNVEVVISLTARLAQLLAEEVDLLADMKVAKIKDLQKEKMFLTNALEAQRKLLDKHPHLTETIPATDREDLKRVVTIFEDILHENHRKLLKAKEVNEQVVQAITKVVRDTNSREAYGTDGACGIPLPETLSVTYDHRV